MNLGHSPSLIIDLQNIFDLILAERSAYHACVITVMNIGCSSGNYPFIFIQAHDILGQKVATELVRG